jgi:hypothetical protein
MEKRPAVKRLLIIAGILTLTLVAFLAGGIVLYSAHAASMGSLDQQGTPGAANGVKATAADIGVAKGTVTVNSVAGNTIRATILDLPNFPKNSAVTITTTASTKYDPDRSVVAPGKTIFVQGTVNQDGGITASSIGFSDPTMGHLNGTITNINGSTITVQADVETTVLVTGSTTFSKELYDLPTHTKTSQPASFSDLAVGEFIKVDGTLNSDGTLTASNIVIGVSDGGTKSPSGTGTK